MKCEDCQSDIKGGRSSPDHRRFFKLIAAAFNQWPHNHEFTPVDAEDLRSWLLCKAGYFDRTYIECSEAEGSAALAKLIALSCESAIRASNGRGFVKVHADKIVVFAPKSIAWAKLGQKQFNEVRDAVTAAIEAELRVTADLLLKESERAA